MKKIFQILILGVMIGSVNSLSAQKVGYVNMEAVLILMPEMKNVNKELQTYRQKLEEQLKIKSDYAGVKYQEFLEKQEAGASDEDLQAIQGELQKLQTEVQQYAQDSDQKFMMRRQDLMQPVIDKLQGELDAIADTEGYDIILNAVDGSGLSVILYGPEEHNLTPKVLEKLGIEVSETASADSQ